jgi:regulatory subunit for Cdc7p protein kinase
MAQVSIPPSPAAMSRRAPLSNLPNAVNSTYQMSTVTKRSRSQSTAQRDVTYGQPPPKKQAVEASSVLRTPRRSQNANAKVVPQKKAAPRVRPATGGPPTFADIGQAARKPAVKTAETTEEQIENVRAWQRHYRKAFPAYVFYFENIPSETQLRAQKQILALGAVSAAKT